MKHSASILQIRLDELEASHAFIALYYTLRAAEHLEEWAKAHDRLGETDEAKGVRRAAGYLYELADEQRKKSELGVGDIT